MVTGECQTAAAAQRPRRLSRYGSDTEIIENVFISFQRRRFRRLTDYSFKALSRYCGFIVRDARMVTIDRINSSTEERLREEIP